MTGLPVDISVEEIIAIHDAALARYGGLAGMRQEGCLEQVHGSAPCLPSNIQGTKMVLSGFAS